MNEEMKTHYRVKRTLDDLDRLRPKVALGFFIFWALLAVAFVVTVLYYWVL